MRVGDLKSSTLLKRINKYTVYVSIKYEFLRWNKEGGKVLNGLIKELKNISFLYLNFYIYNMEVKDLLILLRKFQYKSRSQYYDAVNEAVGEHIRLSPNNLQMAEKDFLNDMSHAIKLLKHSADSLDAVLQDVKSEKLFIRTPDDIFDNDKLFYHDIEEMTGYSIEAIRKWKNKGLEINTSITGKPFVTRYELDRFLREQGKKKK